MRLYLLMPRNLCLHNRSKKMERIRGILALIIVSHLAHIHVLKRLLTKVHSSRRVACWVPRCDVVSGWDRHTQLGSQGHASQRLCCLYYIAKTLHTAAAVDISNEIVISLSNIRTRREILENAHQRVVLFIYSRIEYYPHRYVCRSASFGVFQYELCVNNSF